MAFHNLCHEFEIAEISSQAFANAMHLFLCKAVGYFRQIIFCSDGCFGLHFEFELEVVAIVSTFPVLNTPLPVTENLCRRASLLLSSLLGRHEL